MLPAIPAIGSLFAGGIIAGLVQFFASRAGMILAGLGLTYIGVKGLETLIGFVVGDINTLVSLLQSQAGSVGGSGLGALMLKFAAFAGLFDGLNIVISGYMAYTSLLGVRFILGRLK